MIDRALGVAGLALAFVFGVVQYFLPQLPGWVSAVGIGVGIFLLGISAGLIMVRKHPATATPVEKAVLRLHIYPDYRTPERIFAEHVFRWYYLKNDIMGLDTTGQATKMGTLVTLFVTFEPEVKVSTLKVRSPDVRLPPHEVKDFNQKYAIIAFHGEIPEGTLEIAVEL